MGPFGNNTLPRQVKAGTETLDQTLYKFSESLQDGGDRARHHNPLHPASKTTIMILHRQASIHQTPSTITWRGCYERVSEGFGLLSRVSVNQFPAGSTELMIPLGNPVLIVATAAQKPSWQIRVRHRPDAAAAPFRPQTQELAVARKEVVLYRHPELLCFRQVKLDLGLSSRHTGTSPARCSRSGKCAERGRPCRSSW